MRDDSSCQGLNMGFDFFSSRLLNCKRYQLFNVYNCMISGCVNILMLHRPVIYYHEKCMKGKGSEKHNSVRGRYKFEVNCKIHSYLISKESLHSR